MFTSATNPTKNRHKVASLVAKLQLSDHEKSLIFKLFSHLKFINEIVYQAAPHSVLLLTTGQSLMEIH